MSQDKTQKAFRTDGGYCCPSCGFSTTEVVSTTPFEKYVLRKRHCVLCGFSHETMEIFTDSFSILQFAHQKSVQGMQE